MDKDDGVQGSAGKGLMAACALLCVAAVWLAASWHSGALAFRDNLAALVPGIFGSMLLVALFVERMIEVFVSLWAPPQVAAHQQAIAYWLAQRGRLKRSIADLVAELNSTPGLTDERKAAIAALLDTARQQIEQADQQVDQEEKALLPYTMATVKATTWVGLVLGMITSAAGFRFLGQIMVLAPIAAHGLPLALQEQYSVFIAVDVVLTGAVLAGGSKLVHQIFSVYTAFTTSLARSAQAKGLASST